MTIPIRPGPFQFLALLGQAAGTAVAEGEKDRQRKLKEAQDRINMLINLRKDGYIGPEAFSTPEIMRDYEQLGISPLKTEKTAVERKEDIARQYMSPDSSVNIPLSSLGPAWGGADVNIPTAGPNSVSDERAQAAGLPTSAERAKTQMQGETMRTGTPEQRQALAGIPNATTERANQERSQDELFNNLASRSVDSVLTNTNTDVMQLFAAGKLPALVDQAWQVAQADARQRGYVADEKYTRPYIEAAVQMKLLQQQELAIRRMAASNVGINQDVRWAELLQRQQQRMIDMLRTLPKPSDQDLALAAQYDKMLNATTDPVQRQRILTDMPAIIRSAHDRVQQFNELSSMIRTEIAGSRDQLQGQIGQRLPGVEPIPGREGSVLSDQQVDAIVQRMRTQKIPITQIDTDLQKGLISASDAQRIKARFNQGRK